MAQFGAGTQFVGQCPVAPTPDGWRPWTDADGPIPDGLQTRARALVDDQATPLGTTESYPLPGVTALIRVEPRIWGRDENGALVQGCFRAGGIYLLSGTPAGLTPPAPSKLDRTVGVLTAASLLIGIGATLVSWGKK